MKACKKCGKTKDLSLFHKHAKTRDGRHGVCKKCHLKRTTTWRKENPEKVKQYQRNRVYKLEEGWYEDKLVEQGFRCAGCLIHQSKLKYSLCVDHCHDTEIPRGLLCKPCNLALGNCNDDGETLRRLAAYAENWEAQKGQTA